MDRSRPLAGMVGQCRSSALCIRTPAEAEALASALKALADVSRIQIVTMLDHAGAAGVCGCDILEHLDVGQSTVSHHLKILTRAGLVTAEKHGTWVFYWLDRQALRDALTSVLQ
jgi:ArsR family transcriptional regulator